MVIESLYWDNTISITAILLSGNLIFEKITGNCKEEINLNFIK